MQSPLCRMLPFLPSWNVKFCQSSPIMKQSLLQEWCSNCTQGDIFCQVAYWWSKQVITYWMLPFKAHRLVSHLSCSLKTQCPMFSYVRWARLWLLLLLPKSQKKEFHRKRLLTDARESSLYFSACCSENFLAAISTWRFCSARCSWAMRSSYAAFDLSPATCTSHWMALARARPWDSMLIICTWANVARIDIFGHLWRKLLEQSAGPCIQHWKHQYCVVLKTAECNMSIQLICEHKV